MDFKIKESFVIFNANLYGDYKKFTCSVDNTMLFNINSFILNRNNKYKSFYVDFTQTGNFRQFLQISGKEEFYLFDEAFNKVKNIKVRLSESYEKGNSEIFFSLDKKAKSKNTTPNVSFFKSKNNTDIEGSQSSSLYDSKIKDIIENHLLAPFFISDPVFKLDANKIEEYISQKYPIDSNQLNDKLVFEYVNEINLIGVPFEIKKYKISNNKALISSKFKCNDKQDINLKKPIKSCPNIEKAFEFNKSHSEKQIIANFNNVPRII